MPSQRCRPTFCHRLIIAAAMACAAGCITTPRQYWSSLKGESFPGWSENMASASRGNGAKTAEPSGFFTNRKSEQIEKDLGGGF
jgi:hypothetical protein